PHPPASTLFPYTTLFRSNWGGEALYNSHDNDLETDPVLKIIGVPCLVEAVVPIASLRHVGAALKLALRFLVSRGFETKERLEYRSEEHTSELQSRSDLVC